MPVRIIKTWTKKSIITSVFVWKYDSRFLKIKVYDKSSASTEFKYSFDRSISLESVCLLALSLLALHVLNLLKWTHFCITWLHEIDKWRAASRATKPFSQQR